MRTVYLFLLALLSVLCWSCYDDQGNYDYHELNRTEVTGIKPVYRCDLLSRLSIPTVSSRKIRTGHMIMCGCIIKVRDRKRSILFRGRKIWIGSFGQVREFIGLFSNIAISRPVL